MRVELDIFSGRPNPTLELSSSENKHVISLLQETPASNTVSQVPNLGYRGFILYLPKPMRVYKGYLLGTQAKILDPMLPENKSAERWLVERIKHHIDSAVYNAVIASI